MEGKEIRDGDGDGENDDDDGDDDNENDHDEDNVDDHDAEDYNIIGDWRVHQHKVLLQGVCPHA